MVTEDNLKEIYWENNNYELVTAENYYFLLDKLTRAKWFNREVNE